MSSVFLIKVACIVVISSAFWYVFKKLNLNAGHFILFILGLFGLNFVMVLLSR